LQEKIKTWKNKKCSKRSDDIQSGSGSKKFSKNPDPRLRKSGSGTTLVCGDAVHRARICG